jgi:hypothetical protein
MTKRGWDESKGGPIALFNRRAKLSDSVEFMGHVVNMYIRWDNPAAQRQFARCIVFSAQERQASL